MKNIMLIAVLAISTGCTTLGPNVIQNSRTDYNIALRRTEDEQLLLNIVRLRYRDQVLFLEASALTTQFTIGGSADIGGTFTNPENAYRLGGGIVFEENPTVTYTPLQGQDFVERMLSPIPLETLILLDGSGWSTERILRTSVQRMNGLQNAPRADGPTPAEAPEYEAFLRASRLLRSLEIQELVDGAREGDNGVVVLRFAPRARDLPEYRELTQLLGLDPERLVYPLTTAVAPAATSTVSVRTRSFVGMMYFLSQSVDVPAGDAVQGRVTITRDDAGNEFDWNLVTADLMRVRHSDSRPENAAVAVFYRNGWFYIDDSDLSSKSTFSMLGQIFALQAGNIESVVPVLTLPVAGD